MIAPSSSTSTALLCQSEDHLHMKVTGIALWLPTFPASGKSYQKKNKLIRLDGATRQKGHFLIPYTKKETRHDKTQTNLTTYTERKGKR